MKKLLISKNLSTKSHSLENILNGDLSCWTQNKNCEFIYIHNQIYKPTSEGRIHPSDPLIKIEWPLEVKNLSALDSNQPFLDPNWPGIRV